MTAGEGGGGDFNFKVDGLSGLGVDGNKVGGLNPGRKGPAVADGRLDGNGSTLGIVNDEVFDGDGVVLGSFRVVSDF